jgi:hypothetical protein
MTLSDRNNEPRILSGGLTYIFTDAVKKLERRFEEHYRKMAFFDVDGKHYIPGMSQEDLDRFRHEDAPDLFLPNGAIRPRPGHWSGWAFRSADGQRAGIFVRRTRDAFGDVDGADTKQTLHHEFFHCATVLGIGTTLKEQMGYADTSHHHPVVENAADGGALLSLHLEDKNFDWLNWHERRSGVVAQQAVFQGDITHLSSFSLDCAIRDIRAGRLRWMKDADVPGLADAYADACTPPDESLYCLSGIAEKLRGADRRSVEWPEKVARALFKETDDPYVHYVGAKVVQPWIAKGFGETVCVFDPVEEDESGIIYTVNNIRQTVDFGTAFWQDIRVRAEKAAKGILDPDVPVNYRTNELIAAIPLTRCL